MKLQSELLLVCLLGALQANPLPEEIGLSEDEQHVERRYVESTITSEISKIMDSMMQKNFVNFLLSHREKKSRPEAAEDDAEERLYNDLLKLRLQEKWKKLT